MNVGEKKEVKYVPEKKEMLNTSKVKYVVTADYEYEFHFLNHLLTNL